MHILIRKMMQANLLRPLCTLGPVGYLPASGTIATVVTLPLVIFLAQTGWIFYSIVTLLLTVAAFQICTLALPSFAKADPKEVVIDEVVGCLFTFIGLPIDFVTILIGFIFFRFFDIFKIVGIARLEKHYGARGVMLDDIAAGILANIIVRIIMM